MGSADDSTGEAGLTGRTRVSEDARQAVLDAAALLQVRRTEAAALAAGGGSAEVELVGRGINRINRWIREVSETWRDLLSVRPVTSAEDMRRSLPNNRAQVERGMHMVSVFDLHATDLEARILLANETVGTYLLSFAPVQMKIVDRTFVLLQGPVVDGEPTVISVRSAPCLDAAWRYWDAVMEVAAPVHESVASLAGLTPRQHQVIALMASGAGDEAIAAGLGVSVRTVRSDVAAVLDALGVRTRFAAGTRLQLWSGTDE
jgi:DNA-binding CsgD family transcriptional regulator